MTKKHFHHYWPLGLLERIPVSGADVMTRESFYITGLCAGKPPVSADIPLTKGQ